MSNSLCYRCGETFYKGHLIKCKAMNRQCFRCQKFGHLSKQCRNSYTKQMTILIVKKKSVHKTERDQKRWNEFQSRRLSAMELPFYSVESQTEFVYAINSLSTKLSFGHKRKNAGLTDMVRDFKRTIAIQKKQLLSLESKLSVAWKKSKEEKERKKLHVEGLEEKLQDARKKNKALEKKIGRLDTEIFELKEAHQSVADRLVAKERQLSFITLMPPVPTVPIPLQKKSVGINTDTCCAREVSDASTQMPAMVARRTGKVWYPPGHPNHVEAKASSRKKKPKIIKQSEQHAASHNYPASSYPRIVYQPTQQRFSSCPRQPSIPTDYYDPFYGY